MNGHPISSADLLVEVGTLELPARLASGLSREFAFRLLSALREDSWVEPETRAEAWYTPRRLAVRILRVRRIRLGQTVVHRGPSLDRAFDAKGRPTAAALGFAAKQGVEWETLGREEGHLVFRFARPDTGLDEVLAPMIERILTQLPCDREMRWSSNIPPFVRPIRTILLLHGDHPVPGRVYGVEAAPQTLGHPVHHPEPLSVERSEDYERVLASGRVLLQSPGDPGLRDRIWELVETAAHDWHADWLPVRDEKTLAEVADMVEWPCALAGSFPEHFLALPEAVLAAVLLGQQRVFPLRDAAGHWKPGFVAVVNLESQNRERVRRGEERVVCPRLADAHFFYQEDLKLAPAERLPALGEIVFARKLGNLGQRRERLMDWMSRWAEALGVDAALAREAGSLVLADLTSRLVGEFPELAGIAGAIYAGVHGAPPTLCQALAEAYLPGNADNLRPQTTLGRALSMALRIDLLAGYFLIGEKPTGQRDPYALRRAALGLVRLLDPVKDPSGSTQGMLPTLLNPPLTDLFQSALEAYPDALGTRDAQELSAFTLERFRGLYLDGGGRADHFEAVLATQPSTIAMTRLRLNALDGFQGRSELATLIQIGKRVTHLLKHRNEPETDGGRESAQSGNSVETVLATLVSTLEPSVTQAASAHRYDEILRLLCTLEDPLSRFFDQVLVLSPDPALKARRLALLERINLLLTSVADLSRLQTPTP
jgi:glycyl-tRNA synthetase beta chain